MAQRSLGQFMAGRRAVWERLEALLARARGNGLRRLSAAELDELGQAYRRTASDLALARRDFPQDQLTASLNALVARAHLTVYRAPGASARRLLAFFTVDFARRFRQAGGYLGVAALLFFVPAVGGYLAALLDPLWRDALVPRDAQRIMAEGRTWTEIEEAMRPAVAALIFVNNLQVSFLAFAGGVLFGLGTAFVLVMNGLSIGGILGGAHHYGVGLLLGEFVSAHGYIEITSILIAAAAGLMLGHALLQPGLLRRRDAAARAGRRAVELVLGAAPVFVFAGLVEGFVSPSGLAPWAKAALGPLLGAALLGLLLLLGREPRRGRAP